MFDLFDVPWSGLDLTAVQSFFEDAGDEGVTWEAKADDEKGRLRPDSVAKAACGLANQVGGYVIIGAKQEEKGGPWTVPGITPPRDEPGLWIGKVLRGLNPVPRFDSQDWTLADGRLVAVVQVDPVAQTPCMTRNGRIYERVSGETLPVEDPALLDRLFRRGEHARERAEQFADRAAARALAAPDWHNERALGFGLALAPIGRETDDISSRLFIPSFQTALTDTLDRYVGGAHPDRHYRSPNTKRMDIEQDALTALAHYTEQHILHAAGSAHTGQQSTWRLQATWDGTVAAGIAFTTEAISEVTSIEEELLLPSWQAVAGLVALLGGYGPAILTVAFETTTLGSATINTLRRSSVPKEKWPLPPRGSLYSRLPETTEIRRWVTVGDPDAATVASIRRELDRAAGRDSLEPEDEPADDPAPAA